MKKISLFLSIVYFLFTIALQAQNVPLSHYEGYYLKTGTYPDDATNWWMHNGLEVQGVANDGENWFFTLTKKDESDGMLRRIPKSVPLAPGLTPPSNPGIGTVMASQVPQLGVGNWHWGAPDHYKHINGVNYILVPIPGPIVACFRADNLQYVNYMNLSQAQDYAGWCAVGVDGAIYSSNNHATSILRYAVDWETFLNEPNNHNVATLTNEYGLKNSNGTTISALLHMQGGEFTPSGELLYIVCGSAGCLGFGPGQPEPSDGIHVFETVEWKEVKHSTNSSGGMSHFNYNFNNGCTCLSTGSQSPEGLTIWDLNDGSAPNISGHLHVIVDHYNEGPCDDAITMQHFGGDIYVDKNNGFDPPTNPLTGTLTRPFKTVNAAYDFYPIWDGAKMVINAGMYNEIGFYNKRILITSIGGTVVIGQE